jgi:hypothetical protein
MKLAAPSTASEQKSPLKPLKRKDYPNVKYWDREPRGRAPYAAIKVAATSDNGDDSSSETDDAENVGSRTKGKSKIFAFLENEDGELISLSEKEALYSEVRGWWNENIDPARVPQNWSSAGATLRDQFRNDIEEKFFFLQLCSAHWKVEAIWKKNYHSWKSTLRSRLKEESDRNHCRSDDTPVKKRRPSNTPGNDDGVVEDKSEDPRPKKKVKLAEKDKGKMVRQNIIREYLLTFACFHSTLLCLAVEECHPFFKGESSPLVLPFYVLTHCSDLQGSFVCCIDVFMVRGSCNLCVQRGIFTQS